MYTHLEMGKHNALKRKLENRLCLEFAQFSFELMLEKHVFRKSNKKTRSV